MLGFWTSFLEDTLLHSEARLYLPPSLQLFFFPFDKCGGGRESGEEGWANRGGGATSDRSGKAQSSSEGEGRDTGNERQKPDCEDATESSSAPLAGGSTP